MIPEPCDRAVKPVYNDAAGARYAMRMKGTRWLPLLDEFARRAHRELRVTLTRPASPDRWLFLVGCYNSGTTLIADVLGEHPQIAALPDEGQYLTDQLLLDYKIGLPRMWVGREDLFRMDETSTGPDVQRMRKEWAMRLPHKAPVVLEKTPANMARTRWLQANFPNAHFVGILRNPYAVIDGIRRKADPQHLATGWPIEMCARQWARSNEVLAEDATHLDRFMWLRYEDFVNATAESIARVLEFVGLPQTMQLEQGQTRTVHERREPIRDMNAESIAGLAPDDVRAINSLIGRQVEVFGYSRLET
jgi:hypothetical protein